MHDNRTTRMVEITPETATYLKRKLSTLEKTQLNKKRKAQRQARKKQR